MRFTAFKETKRASSAQSMWLVRIQLYRFSISKYCKHDNQRQTARNVLLLIELENSTRSETNACFSSIQSRTEQVYRFRLLHFSCCTYYDCVLCRSDFTGKNFRTSHFFFPSFHYSYVIHIFLECVNASNVSLFNSSLTCALSICNRCVFFFTSARSLVAEARSRLIQLRYSL